MNILGTYSGIGMETVDQLIEAEKSKGVQFTNRKTKIERQQTAWKDVSTRLNALYKNIEKLQNTETYQSQTVKSNVKDSSFLSVSANNKAASGVYRMEVKELATASSLAGNKVTIPDLTPEEKKANMPSIDKKLNFTGTFSFESEGEQSLTKIVIGEEDSLRTIVNNINAETKKSGVQASIIDDRIILTDTSMGAREITISNDGVAEQLGFVKDGQVVSLTDDTRGNDAVVMINGLEVESKSNQITDAVEGLTINLTNKHIPGDVEVITVAQDVDKTVDAVKEFVDQYNSVMSFIKEQTDFGDPTAENNKTGALAGESAIIRLQSSLRSMLTRNLRPDKGEVSADGFKNISELGIEIDRYGVASLDESTLRKEIAKDSTKVAHFFYQPATPASTDAQGEPVDATEKRGMSELLKNFVDSYTSTSKGIIKTTQDSYERSLKDITQQIEIFNERIDRKRDRYIREFTALDQAMMQAESQLDYLYSQMGIGQN